MTTHSNPLPIKPPTAIGRWLVLLMFLCAIGAYVYFDLGAHLSLATLQSSRDELLAYTERHFGAAALLFVAIYIVQTALSLPGGAILTLAAGFLFGVLPGVLIVNVGATLGATAAFLVARYLLRDWIERRFGARLGAIQAGFARNAFHYLLTLRLVPIFPFFLVNLVSGLTRMRLATYMAATALGIIPGSVIYAYAGRQLGTLDSVADIATPPMLLALSLLGALALVPVIYRRYGARTRTKS